MACARTPRKCRVMVFEEGFFFLQSFLSNTSQCEKVLCMVILKSELTLIGTPWSISNWLRLMIPIIPSLTSITNRFDTTQIKLSIKVKWCLISTLMICLTINPITRDVKWNLIVHNKIYRELCGCYCFLPLCVTLSFFFFSLYFTEIQRWLDTNQLCIKGNSQQQY